MTIKVKAYRKILKVEIMSPSASESICIIAGLLLTLLASFKGAWSMDLVNAHGPEPHPWDRKFGPRAK